MFTFKKHIVDSIAQTDMHIQDLQKRNLRLKSKYLLSLSEKAVDKYKLQAVELEVWSTVKNEHTDKHYKRKGFYCFFGMYVECNFYRCEDWYRWA